MHCSRTGLLNIMLSCVMDSFPTTRWKKPRNTSPKWSERTKWSLKIAKRKSSLPGLNKTGMKTIIQNNWIKTLNLTLKPRTISGSSIQAWRQGTIWRKSLSKSWHASAVKWVGITWTSSVLPSTRSTLNRTHRSVKSSLTTSPCFKTTSGPQRATLSSRTWRTRWIREWDLAKIIRNKEKIKSASTTREINSTGPSIGKINAPRSRTCGTKAATTRSSLVNATWRSRLEA